MSVPPPTGRAAGEAPWPPGFRRIPDEAWTGARAFQDRQALLHEAAARVFPGADTFLAEWTCIDATA